MNFLKVFTVFVVLIGLFFSCKKENASSKVKKENVIKAKERNKLSFGEAKISIDNDVYDFGVAKEGDTVRHSFIIKNIGTADLIIVSASASCGCTVPTWPKDAIPVGKSAEVQVEFDTTGKGDTQKHSKSVNLITNTVNGREKLRITGMVIPE